MAGGLMEWLRGDDTEDAEAAAHLVAELALRGLAYLRAIEKAAKEK